MKTYWWHRPSRIALAIVMPLAVLAYAASNQYYESFGAFNAMTEGEFFLMFLSILGFAGASWIGEILVTDRMQQPSPYVRESGFRVIWFGLGVIAVAASVIYVAPVLANPSIFLAIFEADPDASYIARSQVNQIAGITSMDNLSGLVAILFMLKPTLTGCRRTHDEKLLFAIVLVVATLRVIAHGGERLPLIELLVPVLLLTSALNRRSVGWAFAPVAGAIGLYVLFMGTEYLRSWASFYSTRSGSLLEFAFNRLVGYYLTAINNGAYVYGQQPFSFFPLRTSMWLWRLPVPDLPEVLAAIGGLPSTPPALFDNELLNPEFTNSSGIFAPLSDYGPAFGIVVWVLLGHFSGRLYRSFAERRWLGLILFPTWYVGVLELSRLFYWGDQRYFPQLVVSLTVVFIFSLIPRRGASLGVDYRILGQGSGRPSSGTIVAPESVQDP